MKNKKGYTIFFIVLGIYAAVVIILFGIDGIRARLNNMYIVIDPNTKWKFVDRKWQDMGEETKLYNWNKYDIYLNNKLFGNYDLLYNDKWFIFDNMKSSVTYSGNLFAYRGTAKIEVADFTPVELDATDEILLYKVLESKGITNVSTFSTENKVVFDLDSDNKDETIYYASNLFSEDYQGKKIVFSILFTVDGRKTNILYFSEGIKSDEYNFCKPFVNNIIDLYKDGKYEIITGCGYFSSKGTCHEMYGIKSGKYTLMKGC